MMDTDIQQALQTFCTELFRIARLESQSVEVKKESATAFRIDVTLTDAGLAIGPDGEHLRAWGEVCECFAARIIREHVSVVVDINNYRWQMEERLRELAHRAAKEAMFTRQPVKLPFMNAYERRIIHTELALRPDINTESEGEDPNRYIVVKPLV